MDFSDKAKETRRGEELDVNAVKNFMKDNIKGLEGSIRIQQFPGGYSNLTYLVTAGNREMVLRRPPIGAKIKSAHDMGREYRILKSLRPVFPYCPEALTYTEDTSIMGCPFYIMERIPGIILRKDIPEGMTISKDKARLLCENLLDVHVELHKIDVKETGLDFLGKPEGYVKRQVDGWSKRYRKARTEDAPDFEEIMSWLKEKMPPDTDDPVIIHNDYKLDNVVLKTDGSMDIIGVLDWEMATYGDPLMDLGSSLSYWIEKDDPEELHSVRVLLTHIDGALKREELLQRYGDKTGRDIDKFDFYFCFGLFRNAVIAQQIYHRYYNGLTKDNRFAMLIFAVHIIEKAAKALIDLSKI